MPNLKNKKVIKDQQGQRKYPGRVTEIQGNTMATTGYGDIPLYVVPNVGNPMVVPANSGNRVFPGASSFTEYPIAKNGGWLEKYQDGGKTLEQKINKALGDPRKKAADAAINKKWFNKETKKWEVEDDTDNFRHPMAARYTAEAIANKFPDWMKYSGIPQVAGFVGSTALGVGHELANNKYTSNDPKDYPNYTFWDTVSEAGEDAFNNIVGAGVGVLPISDDKKTSFLKYLSDNNMLPDGLANKKEYGGWLEKYGDGGETDPPGGLKNNQWMGANLNKEGYITSETKGGNRISFTSDQKADDFFNKQIDSGKWGFDPKTGGTFLLKKPVKGLSKEDQFMATKEYDDLSAIKGFTNESQKEQIAKLPKFQQDIINAENEKRRKKVVSDSMQEVGKHPLFYAPGIIGAAPFAVAGLSEAGMASAPYIQGALSTQLPGMANVSGATVGNAITAGFAGHGATHITPDAIEMYKNPSWSNAGNLAMDVAEISPLIGPTSKVIGKGLNATKKAYNNVATGNSFIPYAWKSPMPKITQANSESFFNNIISNANLTAKDKELWAKYQYESYPYKQVGSPEHAEMSDLIKRSQVNFPKDMPLVRMEGHANFEEPIVNAQGIRNIDRPTSFSSGRGQEFPTNPTGNGQRRIIIPPKYAKSLENKFGKNPYAEAINGQNAERLKVEKEIVGEGFKLKQIGKVKNELGDYDYIMKPIEFNKNTPSSSNVDFSKYLTQEEAVAARGERLISQKNKPGWNEQLTPELEQRLSTAVERHNPASDYAGEKLGANTMGRTATEVSKDANLKGVPLNEANKSRVAAHETGHYYSNSPAEGEEWLSHFNLNKLESYKTRTYLRGKGRSANYANEIRERAAQLKDYIAQKNEIPLNQDFKITQVQLDDAIKNYVKDTGLDNTMSKMLGSLKDKKGLLKTMNKYALGTIPAVIGAEALQNKQDNSQWLDKYQDGGYVVNSGDNLSTIAKNNNTDIATLQSLNNIKDVNRISVGQNLMLPKKQVGINNANVNTAQIKDLNSYSFNEAFKIARKQLGPNKIFEHNGKKFGTNLAGEKFVPDQEELAKNNMLNDAVVNHLNDQNKKVESVYTTKNTVKLQPTWKENTEIDAQNQEFNKLKNAELINKYQSLASPNEKYIIVDKKKGKMHVYLGGKEIESYNVGTGENKGDEQTRTWVDKKTHKTDWSKGNKQTGAGIYTISFIDEHNKHYSNAPSFHLKNESGTEVPTAIHAGFGDRLRRIANNDVKNNDPKNGEDTRFSNGCINGLCKDMTDLYKNDLKQDRDKNTGTKVFILPDDDSNYFSVKNNKLNFTTSGKYNQTTAYSPKNLNASPIKIKVLNKDFETKEVKNMVKTLEDNKSQIMKDANIDNDTYNRLSKMAISLSLQETKGGTDYNIRIGGHGIPGTNKEEQQGLVSGLKNAEALLNKYKKDPMSSVKDFAAFSFFGTTPLITEKTSVNSKGMTQIKYDAQNKELVSQFKKYGITKDNLNQGKNAAIATVLMLSYMNNNELPSLKEKIKKMNISDEEALLYLNQGKKSEIVNGTATPKKNMYINNIKKYSNQISLKQQSY